MRLKKKNEAIQKLLQPWRSYERKYWIEVGWCLKNIHPGLLEEWIIMAVELRNYL